MKQIIYIGGWACFRSEDAFTEALKSWHYEPFKETKKWKYRLKEILKEEYDMEIPNMPNTYNARYSNRKIWFEKIFPCLNDEKIVLIGHSQWSIFLTKYLSENIFPKNIAQLHLVGTVFDEQGLAEWDDYLADFVFDPTKLKNLEQQVDTIFLYHSKDDSIVPFSHAEKYKAYLPNAIFNIFDDRQHFWWSEFPELLENIKKN